MTTAWTAQQEALFSAVRSTSANVIAESVAGSGKSTTSVHAAGQAGEKRIGFVAFNTHIAKDLKGKLRGSADACTLHSLGRSALLKAFPDSELDERKGERLAREVWPEETWQRRQGIVVLRPPAKAVLELARACKLTLTSPEDQQKVAQAVDVMGIELPPRYTLADLLPRVGLLLERMQDDVHRHDYDDMLWLPTHLGLPTERYDLLFVDEAQDLSPLQRAVALSAAGDGRVCLVGDSKQSINAFCGSDPDSFPFLKSLLSAQDRGARDCSLTITFRCPASHVALAQQIVPWITARPGAPDGAARVITAEEFRGVLRPGPGDLVLSRRNAPLVGICLNLLSEGLPACMVGRDLGRGLLDLIRQLGKENTAELILALDDWLSAKIDELERKGASDTTFQAVQDRAQCVRELAAKFSTTARLVDFIQTKLAVNEEADRSKVISCSSVHRAKGLEAERVYLVDTESLPLVLTCRQCRGSGQGPLALSACPACKGRGSRQGPVQVQQEWNLLYVALTRGKREMYFVGGEPAGLAW